jgi:Family of unknown function (DUF6152)
MTARASSAALLAIAVIYGTPAWSHHSVVTFDLQKTIEFDGVVKDWAETNPHGYLTVSVDNPQDAAGSWRCESYSVSALTRLGVTASSFKVGDRVHITAAASRMDPRACLLEAVRFSDGREVSLRSGQSADAPTQASAAAANSSIYGTWTPLGNPIARLPPRSAVSQRPLAMTIPELEHMTPAGQKATAAYDPIKDDPIYHCSPINPVRLWHEPDTDMAIRRDGNRVVLRYEFMDAERVIYLDQRPPGHAPMTILGTSVGHFEGDTLVVQSDNFAPGLAMQYALNAQGKLSGVLHSDAYTLTERIRFEPSSQQLEVQYEQTDPKYYLVPLPAGTVRFRTSVNPILGTFNCHITAPPSGS